MGFSPRFIPGPAAPKDIDYKVKEICGDAYEVFEEILNEIRNSPNKYLNLKRLERAAIAYDKLPDDMKIEFIKEYGLVKNEDYAKELLNKLARWMKKVRKTSLEDTSQ